MNAPLTLITGASGGLGFDILKLLSRRNIPLAVGARNTRKMQTLLQTSNLHDVKIVKMDFNAPANEMVAAVSTLNNLKTVIHYASPYTETNLQESIPSILDEYGNFFASTLALLKASLLKMEENHGGRIIVTGSVAGVLGV